MKNCLIVIDVGDGSWCRILETRDRDRAPTGRHATLKPTMGREKERRVHTCSVTKVRVQRCVTVSLSLRMQSGQARFHKVETILRYVWVFEYRADVRGLVGQGSDDEAILSLRRQARRARYSGRI